jgi:hypothetical protein
MDLDKLGGRKTEKTTKDSCVAGEQRSEYLGDHGKKSRLLQEAEEGNGRLVFLAPWRWLSKIPNWPPDREGARIAWRDGTWRSVLGSPCHLFVLEIISQIHD